MRQRLWLLTLMTSMLVTSHALAQMVDRCNTRNCPSGGDVTVDLQENCMCIKTGWTTDCFYVDIGSSGPGMTTTGTGFLGKADGVIYDSQMPTPQTPPRNNDAISMGIRENDAAGKWIHQTRDCQPGPGRDTAGCIGVPCDKWALMKQQMGKRLVVCGGGGPASAYDAGNVPKDREQFEGFWSRLFPPRGNRGQGGSGPDYGDDRNHR